MKRIVSGLVMLGVLSLAGVSAAQIKQQAPARVRASGTAEPEVSAVDGATFTVAFKDDPLVSALENGEIPRIVVRPSHAYGMLTRPRLHFVSELTKSVEVF